MSAVSPVLQSGEVSAGQSLAEIAAKLHVQAYRACCNEITRAASFALTTAATPVGKCLNLTRKISLVDICWTSSLKIVNGTFAAVFNKQLIPAESLKTLVQKKHDTEIVRLRSQLKYDHGEEAIHPQFCAITAKFIDEFIPKFIAEKLSVVPSSTEAWLFYKLGYTARYINYQLVKRFNYKESFFSSALGRSIKGNFDGLRTHLTHCLVSKSNLNAILDFEHLLLHVCSKLTSDSKQPQSLRWAATAINSFAISLSQQKKIDQFLEQFSFNSEEEAFIARLEWHKQNNTLPKGLPDPHLERLTPQNLQEKLDEALSKYLNGRVEQFLNELLSKYFKDRLLRVLYYLEGKDMLINLFTFLISEYGVKQLADPHLFALAILYGSGVEVMGYELDGFGRGKHNEILETGQKIMAASSKNNADWKSLVGIFNESKLKNAPGSYEAILQKKEAKEHLRAYIAGVIYNMIKSEQFQHPGGVLKATREKASKIPVLGAATISLHLLINGSLFSLGYLFRSKREGNISYLSWMFKHLSGKNLANFLAGRIIDLIYHPSWRITLLQLIDMLIGTWEMKLKDPKKFDAPMDTCPMKEDLHKITTFLFQHFTQGTSMPFKENVRSWFDYFAGDGTFNLFLETLEPSESSSLEKGMRSLLPTIKELLLYTRVIDSFRMECVHFEGDAKFWECFVREYLNQGVACRLQQQLSFHQRPTLAQISETREKLVDKLLSFDQKKLRLKFSKPPKNNLESQYWEMIPKDQIDEVFFILNNPQQLPTQTPTTVAGIALDVTGITLDP